MCASWDWRTSDCECARLRVSRDVCICVVMCRDLYGQREREVYPLFFHFAVTFYLADQFSMGNTDWVFAVPAVMVPIIIYPTSPIPRVHACAEKQSIPLQVPCAASTQNNLQYRTKFRPRLSTSLELRVILQQP